LLPAQTFQFYLKDGVPVNGPVPGWEYDVRITARGSVRTERYWASGGNCVGIEAQTETVLLDRAGVPHSLGYGPGTVGYTAGPYPGWSGVAVYDRDSGDRPNCPSEPSSVPLDAHAIRRVEGKLTWYKAPPHNFIWNVGLPIPKFVPGPYYKKAARPTHHR
jgi:hypothetical protein